MLKTLAAAAIGLSLLGTADTARAGDAPVLVELYTSQGCSSCPPADDLLRDLAKRDDLVVLALHVDYWDYIGWKDIFGKAEHAQRQRKYARVGGRRMVYTPQMIVAGGESVEGFRPMKLMDAVERTRDAAPDVGLKIARSGNRLSITADRLPRGTGAVSVQLVRYVPSQKVKITRGENRGRTLTYTNIVTKWDTIERWSGRAPLALNRSVQGDEGIAVILQREGQGPVIAAAQLR